jgi:signal transduction histidine kinase
MKVSQRLFLAVIPAILGLFTVAGLAYWGAYHRAAPEWVVVVAAVSAVGSLILAWQNTRYVARRIERLAGVRGQRESIDELDSIEQVVDHLSSAVSVAREGGQERERAATERIEEYALLLDEATAAVRRQLDEARIALHILNDNSFGTLNEHQLEMVDAARTGTEAADGEVGKLHEIAELDRRVLAARRDPVRIGDVLRSLQPQLESEGARTSVTLAIDTPPGLPKLVGDRVRLQRALELLLRHLVRHASPGSALTITAGAKDGQLSIIVEHALPPTLDADVALARRIIQGHGGSIDVAGDLTTISFPVAAAR